MKCDGTSSGLTGHLALTRAPGPTSLRGRGLEKGKAELETIVLLQGPPIRLWWTNRSIAIGL